MNKKDLEYFKKKLLAEKAELEKDLGGLAQRNTKNPEIWEATSKDMKVDSADENEVADKLEELEENSGIVSQLDNQLIEVDAALERIEKGTYGISEKTGEPIDRARLEANPSARESIPHIKK